MDGNWFDDPNAEVPRPGAKPPTKPRRMRGRGVKREDTRRQKPDRRPDERPAGDKVCGAKRKDGGFCQRAAGQNTDHIGYGPCSQHYGDTGPGRRSAAMDMGQELSAFYGSPIDISPIDALLDEVCRTAGHIQWLADRIGKFKVPLTTDEGEIAELPPAVAGWMAVYAAERAQIVRASKAALDAGVNERLVQIAEHQGARLAGAVEEILNALNLSAQQQALVPHVVPNILRGLMTDQPLLIEGTVDGD